jgi:outer membrane protein insertion porin family/translocation and assembly module TamA
VHGVEALSPELRTRIVALARRRLPLNEPFEEERLQQTEGDAAQLLKNSGYAYATVVTSADVNLPKRIASVGVWVTPKHTARLGRVRIEGLGSIPEGPVRRALDLEPGEPYALDRIQGARQAVLDLGVFSSVVIEPDLPPGAEPRDVPLKVKVEVSRLHSVRLGGGVELDSLRSDVHLTAGWEDKNFLGGLRGFLVEVVPGVVLHPTRLPTLKPPKRLLPEGRLRSELRQPGLFEARMTGLVRAQASVHPLVLSGGLPDTAAILGYRELRGSVGVERSFGRLVPTLSHTVQQNSIFAYTGTLDPDLVPVIVSYPELVLDLNLTDHRLRPHKGVSVRGAVQAAGV